MRTVLLGFADDAHPVSEDLRLAEVELTQTRGCQRQGGSKSQSGFAGDHQFIIAKDAFEVC